ncbi:MAG: ribosome biogenesis GTP-binding protein YihA/YsxC [Candidatus Magasanikbacteria bacterium]
MNITSAQFIKGVVEADPILEDGIPQIAFIGRSNVGKSSVINAVVNEKGLARTSSFPGRTQQINLFLINKSFYLVDLPGYGFAKVSGERRGEIEDLINWYFFESDYQQRKVVLIIDAKIGPTKDDMQMLSSLEQQQKNIIVVANKVDKIKKANYEKQLEKIQSLIGNHKIIPFSAEKRFGINNLVNELAH